MVDFLRVLLTNICLDGRTGTEIVTRNIALELLRQGHTPEVFTLEDGPIAEELRLASIPVTTDINTLRGPFDVIHGHHNPTTAIAAARFPDVPAVFVCHDFIAWHDAPPKLANIRRYIAVDKAVEDRLTHEGIAPDRVQVILNAVDAQRFGPGAPLPAFPVRAVLFAKQKGPIREVSAACDLLGISLDVVGPAIDDVTSAPELLMPQYDLVFASAMTALEALACGRPVVVCDGRGLAGMVTGSNFDAWRPLNFGRRTLNRPVEKRLLIDEINKYDAEDATALMARVRDEASLANQVNLYLLCYRAVIVQHRTMPIDSAHSFRMLSDHLQFWSPRRGPAWPWMEERSRLIEQLKIARQERKPVRRDETISFSANGGPTQYLAMHGFSFPESWGAWTEQENASLRLDLAEPLARGALLELAVVPFVNDLHEAFQVRINANGEPIGSRNFHQNQGTQPQTWLLEVPELADVWTIRLDLEIRSPASPQELGLGDDARRLGLGFISLTLRSHSPAVPSPADRTESI